MEAPDLFSLSRANGLVEALEAMRLGSSSEVQENYKLLLCMAAGGLAPRGQKPITAERCKAFELVLNGLSKMALPGEQWVGRPDWMTPELFAALQAESRALHLSAKPTDRYYLAKAGPIAKHLATSLQLSKLVARQFPSVEPTGIGTYIYYNNPGDGLDPHVDTEVYSVNVIMMIDHVYQSSPSNLLVYRDSVIPKEITLRPGELAVINAGSVVHAREDMKDGEHLHILTIGFG